MRRVNWKGWLLLMAAAACGIFVLFTIKFRPLVIAFAENMVQQKVSRAIQEEILEEIYSDRAQYEELVTLERDNFDKITALRTDTILADVLKTRLEQVAYRAADRLENSRVSVPVGTIFAPTYFSGRGPKIEVGVTSLGYVKAEFISSFTAAGINQTRHQLLIELHSQVGVLTAWGSRNVEMVNRMAVTDTVIVGTVPEEYTYIDDTSGDTLGKINDYGS